MIEYLPLALSIIMASFWGWDKYTHSKDKIVWAAEKKDLLDRLLAGDAQSYLALRREEKAVPAVPASPIELTDNYEKAWSS